MVRVFIQARMGSRRFPGKVLAPFQGKAIAEIPNVPTAAAVANAIEDAVGVRILDLPLTAEKIYAALKAK